MGHVDNDFLFTGEQMDAETGLMYMRARYYDPSTGRFITKDPFAGFISDTQSLNRYSYVRNNPVNFIDPLGLCAESKVWNIIDLSSEISFKLTSKMVLEAAKRRPSETSLWPYHESRKALSSGKKRFRL